MQAIASTTYISRLGAGATNPGRLFAAVSDIDGLEFTLADDDQATSFTVSGPHTLDYADNGYRLCGLLPTDYPALICRSNVIGGDDEDGSSFTQYDLPYPDMQYPIYYAIVDGRPALAQGDGVYLRADDNTGTS